MASVGAVLDSLGLGRYLELFEKEDIDMDTLLHLTEDDLKSISQRFAFLTC
jgi:hypothetical protein